MKEWKKWTAEQTQQLEQLWAEGISPRSIANLLGGVTRNAVIGKAHRLGLARRARHTGVQPCPPAPVRTKKPTQTKGPEVVIEPDPVILADGNFVSPLTIGDGMCRWPIGNPSLETFHFCARQQKEGSPYCAIHAHRAYRRTQQPPRTRERESTAA